MENLIPQDFNKLLNSSPEPSPDPPHQGVSQPPFFPKNFENFPSNQDIPKPIGTIESPKINPNEKLLKKLDDYIQSCLHKYKPVEHPDKSLYDNTLEKDHDSIISRKSTIPDLVIWNKKFNKNDCFYDTQLETKNDFPRFTFYLRLGNKDKNKKDKNDKNNKNNKYNNKYNIDDNINNNDYMNMTNYYFNSPEEYYNHYYNYNYNYSEDNSNIPSEGNDIQNIIKNLNNNLASYYSKAFLAKNKKSKKKISGNRPRIGDWTCIYCFNLNFSFRKSCNKCHSLKEEL